MLKITNLTLSSSMEAIVALGRCKLPIDIAFAHGSILRKLQGPIQDYQKAQASAVEMYGKKDEKGVVINDGKSFQIADVKAFNDDMETLYKIEIEIDIDPIKLGDLAEITDKDGKPITMESGHMMALDWLITNPKP